MFCSSQKKLNIFSVLRSFLKTGLKAFFMILALCLSLEFTVFSAAASGVESSDKGNILSLTVHENGKDNVIAIKLRPDLAPLHVAQIKKLVREGAYDDVVFHRVIAGFMAQTGDVQYGKRSRYDDVSVGQGGSHYPNIPAEFSQKEAFTRGTVGMARAGDPNSANSQFFICFADAPFLNSQYTIIGAVVKGMEAVDSLKKGNAVENGKISGNLDYIVKAELSDSTS